MTDEVDGLIPPRDVYVVFKDNTRYPVQTVFSHFDRDGTAIWRVVDIPAGKQVVEMKIGRLPAHTAIEITRESWQGRDGGEQMG